MNQGELNDLMNKYYEGLTSLEEEKQLRKLLLEAKDDGAYMSEKDILSYFEEEKSVKSRKAPFEPEAQDRTLTINPETARKAVAGSSLFLKIAASLLLLVSLSWLLLELTNSPGKAATVTEATLDGQKQLTLPDGSRVTLNQNSRISYPEKFTTNRDVVLEGEGYFEVVRDESKAFRVVTGNVTTEVLGTAFNLRWNKELETVELEVTEGKVAFASFSSGLNERIFVNAGEKAVYRHRPNTIERFEAFNPNLLSWKTKKLVFSNTRLEDVLTDAASYFGVTFQFKGNTLKTCNFTGKLDDPVLEEFLEALKYVLRIEYEIRNDTIVLTGDGC